MRDTTNCPECGESALVTWRSVLESTDGPVEHAKVVCTLGHWFLLPVASMVAARGAAPASGSRSSRHFAPVAPSPSKMIRVARTTR